MWKYEGKHKGFFWLYYYNNGSIVETQKFSTCREALKWLKAWKKQVAELVDRELA